jgi:hypothetical protein
MRRREAREDRLVLEELVGQPLVLQRHLHERHVDEPDVESGERLSEVELPQLDADGRVPLGVGP